MIKIITFLAILFTSGAMLAHALYQPMFNDLDRIDAEAEAYRQSAVVGWWKMDRGTKQLYFVSK